MNKIEWIVQYFGADGNGLTYVDPWIASGFDNQEEAEQYAEELAKSGYTGIMVLPTLDGEPYFN